MRPRPFSASSSEGWWSHLRFGAGIVQHDQHSAVGEAAAVQRRPLVEAGRDLRASGVQRPQGVIERLARLDRLDALGVAVQVDEELPVGVAVGHLVGSAQDQGGLADPKPFRRWS
jgi:hypothetical protein